MKGPEPGSKGSDPRKLVAQNKKARHDYAIEDTFEAGIVLTGTEVKSLRQGRCSLADAYASVQDGEVWLLGAHIPEYADGTRANHDPDRPRKLLLHRAEIDKLLAKAAEKGLTIVPLQIYFKKGIAKVEISVARGRKLYDKREALKAQDAKRDMDRALRRR